MIKFKFFSRNKAPVPVAPVTRIVHDVDIKNEGVILEKSELPFENDGVLNPACIEKDGVIHMFYRAVTIGNKSTIGYARLDRNNKVIYRQNSPFLFPEFEYESQGLEDPRIVLIEGVYYLFYTVYDGISARVAYATSTDLVTFTKKGLISAPITYEAALKLFNKKKLLEKYFWFGEQYQQFFSKHIMLWEKDSFLFPRKINGQFVFVHRIMPGIQFMKIDSLDELQDGARWSKYLSHLEDSIILNPKFWFETQLIGGGAPPIETPQGWIMIYHAVESPSLTYRAGAVLLDLNDPRKVIGRLTEPLFSPTEIWEKKGVVSNVVFPTSVLERDGRLYIYYGGADNVIAVRSVNKELLLNALIKSK